MEKKRNISLPTRAYDSTKSTLGIHTLRTKKSESQVQRSVMENKSSELHIVLPHLLNVIAKKNKMFAVSRISLIRSFGPA